MDFSEIESKMNKTIEVLKQNFSEVRAGRANPAILNKVKMDYYGTPTPINQVAGVSVPEARLIVIQPWDNSLLKEQQVIKALGHAWEELIVTTKATCSSEGKAQSTCSICKSTKTFVY